MLPYSKEQQLLLALLVSAEVGLNETRRLVRDCRGSFTQFRVNLVKSLPTLAVSENSRSRLRDWIDNPVLTHKHSELREQIERLQEDDVALISIWDDGYPLALREIHSPPPLLFIRGEASILNRPQLAFVGSRKATPQGLRMACDIAAASAKAGWVVTSGLALGIDSAAHLGCVQSESPTVAVMATGIGTIYPQRNARLADEILATGGCLLTEFPPGFTARRESFPQRNRIISGMSQGVVVVEAGMRSGSLITARNAIEQNREVFAVPGSPLSDSSSGCHWLIQQGAKLVTCWEDIADELDGFVGARQANLFDVKPRLTGWSKKIRAALINGAMSCDELGVELGIAAQHLAEILVDIELEGHIEQQAGRWFWKSD